MRCNAPIEKDRLKMTDWFELRFPIKDVDGSTTTHALIYSVPEHLIEGHNWEHEQICRWINQERPYSSTEIMNVETRIVVNRDSFKMMTNDGQLKCGVSYLVGPLVRFYPNISPIPVYGEAPGEEWIPLTMPVDCSSASLQSTGGEKQFR